MSEPDQSKSRPTPVVSAMLRDGTLIETIFRESQHQTRLVRHDRGQVSEHEFIDAPALGRMVPYSPDNNLLAHGVVLFPSAADVYDSDADLLTRVRTFIHRYADVSDEFEEVAANYVLLTWVYDAFSEVPYLRLKGDYGSGKSRCLQTIGSICFKPIFASGASTTSPLFRIMDSVRGTLVLDESDFRFSDEKSEIIKILNNGNACGFPVLRSETTPTKEINPRAFHVYGPKIIATRREFEDRALESRCITEVMSGLPPRRDIPLNLPNSFHTEAESIRNALLTYRFTNLRRPRELDQFRDSAPEARVAQVFAPLLAVAQDDDARQRIRRFARGSTAILRSERSASLEAQLVDTIEELRRAGGRLGMGEIAESFAARFGADFDRPITARWIGAQLRRRLSLAPVKSHGTFILPVTEMSRLDGLVERYGIRDDRVDLGTLGTSGDAANGASTAAADTPKA